MIRRWLIVDLLIFAVVFSFAAQICTFRLVYGANGPIAGAAVSASGSEGSGYAVTDSSGQYSISEGLQTGTYTVSVFAVGYITYQTSDVNVNVGQTTAGINFDLQLSGGVSGMVTDADSGNPLASVMVMAYSSNGTYGWAAATGSDGKYLLATNLATGSYNISVLMPDGHISQSQMESVTVGSEVKNVDFALAKSGIISGRITTPSSVPLKDVTVFASGGGSYGYATTNATGHYRMSNGLATGSYTVTAYSGMSFNTMEADVTAGQETSGVDMELTVTPPSPSGIIMGKVTDADTGNPIANATVSASGSEGSGTGETDSNGDYVISDGLGTGTYTVTASAPGYEDHENTGVSVTVDNVTPNINFQLSKLPPAQSGTITGTVIGAPNAIPEFQYPVAVALSVTLVAVAAARLFLRTKRFQERNIK